MIRTKSPADFRPFLPKAKLESQQALEALYGAIAIQDVVEALHHLKASSNRAQPRYS